MLIYLPMTDSKLTAFAGELNEHRQKWVKVPDERYETLVHGATKKVLAGVGEDNILYVLAHGRETTNNEIAAEVSNFFGNIVQKNMTASSLAKQMKSDGLVPRFADLRLLVCWAGMSRYRGGNEQVPFAGQLCGALKEKGYSRIMVTGFKGAVAMVPTRSIIIEPGDNDKKIPTMRALAADSGDTKLAGPMRNTGDFGQSMAQIMSQRDPMTLERRSTWY